MLDPAAEPAGARRRRSAALEGAEIMVIVMTVDATAGDVEAVVDRVTGAGGEAFVSRGVSRVVIGLVGEVDRFEALNLGAMQGVRSVTRISAKYKLVSMEHHPDRSTVYV